MGVRRGGPPSRPSTPLNIGATVCSQPKEPASLKDDSSAQHERNSRKSCIVPFDENLASNSGFGNDSHGVSEINAIVVVGLVARFRDPPKNASFSKEF